MWRKCGASVGVADPPRPKAANPHPIKRAPAKQAAAKSAAQKVVQRVVKRVVKKIPEFSPARGIPALDEGGARA